jgi:hypothetical protein
MRRLCFVLALFSATIFVGHAGAQVTSETATLTDSSCTSATAQVCSLQIYRALAVAGSTPTCPAVGTAYTEIASALAGTTVTATNTTWVYVDSTGLSPSTTYCYYATATYTASGAVSLPSGTLPATTAPPPAPAAPSFTSIVQGAD